MHGFICMDSKTMSHRQQLQHIESHIEESFHSTLLYVLVLSLCIFIRSPYMSSFISLLETTELQNLLAEDCWGKLFFFFFPSDPSGSRRRGDLCGDLPFEEGEGCSWSSKYPDLGFISFSPGLWKHEKSGELICRGGDALPQIPDTQLCLGCFLLWELTLCREGETGGAGLRAEASTNSHHKTKAFANAPCLHAWKGFLGRFLKNQQQESLLPSSISWWRQSPSFPSPLAISWLICLHILTHSCERWKLYCW